MRNRKTTIVKVVNRKFAGEALSCGKHLKGTKRCGGSPIYINNSFCPEFGFPKYAIRNAKKQGILFKWRTRNGVTSVQLDEGKIGSNLATYLT